MKLRFWQRRKNEELDVEIGAHLEASIRERMERGATRAEAEAAARREFGNVALVKDTTRDVWGLRWLDDLAQDLRYAARPLHQGSGFTAAHMQSPMQYAVVDQALARELWPGRDAVGQLITLASDPDLPLTVVGVVPTIRDTGLDQQGGPTVYLPYYPRASGVVIRTAGDAMALVPAIRRILAGLDRRVAPSDIRLMDERVAGWFALQRFLALLLGVFAGAAAFLGVVGLYGVISISVGQRIHEIGVRMALGAQPSDVMRMVLGQAVKLVSTGALIGLVAAAALARLLASLLFGVGPLDPLAYSVIPAMLAVVALVACYVPARRASRVDPMVALRHE